MRISMRAVAVLAATALFSIACGAQQAANSPSATDVGVTKTTIELGGTFPQSGSASAYYSIAKAANGYFLYVNAHGGVNGRKINFTVLDDAYSSNLTPAKARQLVEENKVFATFGDLGTPNNLAVREYYNGQKVPQLFVSTGSPHWGGDYNQYPWTLGWQPDYATESKIYAKYILQNEPNDKVGILYQNDDYGLGYLNGFKEGLGSKADSVIVKTATYNANDPVDMSSQVNTLKASGADTFFVVTTPAYAANAVADAIKVGWKPKLYMNSVSGSTATWQKVSAAVGGATNGVDGMISTVYLKDPLDTAKWGSDAGVKLFHQVMTQYGNGCDPTGADSFCVYGMAVAFTMVDVLKQAGSNMTRKNVMDIAANKLNETNNPLLLPGVIVKTTPGDHFPIQAEQLQKWSGQAWVPFGQVINARTS